MVTLIGNSQDTRPQKLFWEGLDRLRSARTRTRLAFFLALNLVVALAVLPFSGAVTDHTVRASVRQAGDSEYRPLSQVRPPIDDGALYLHSKLMKIATTRSGAPVLRFVECRHYPRQHSKVVQTSINSDGYAVLRIMPGDYCVFASALAPSAAGTQMGRDLDSLQPNQPQAPGSDRPPAQPDPLKELLTPYQRYTCEKFGPACSVALAIQIAENPEGACEIYHYNSSDGTLDWGFFQINTVHLMRPGLNLRDLLDCKANIDFAYQLFRERGFEPWATYVSGAYRKFLGGHRLQLSAALAGQRGSVPFNVLQFK